MKNLNKVLIGIQKNIKNKNIYEINLNNNDIFLIIVI